jgi:hypothetical protein
MQICWRDLQGLISQKLSCEYVKLVKNVFIHLLILFPGPEEKMDGGPRPGRICQNIRQFYTSNGQGSRYNFLLCFSQ